MTTSRSSTNPTARWFTFKRVTRRVGQIANAAISLDCCRNVFIINFDVLLGKKNTHLGADVDEWLNRSTGEVIGPALKIRKSLAKYRIKTTCVLLFTGCLALAKSTDRKIQLVLHLTRVVSYVLITRVRIKSTYTGHISLSSLVSPNIQFSGPCSSIVYQPMGANSRR